MSSEFRGEEGNNKFGYLMSPVSATAVVKGNSSDEPLRSRSLPRYNCDITLDKFPASLTVVSIEKKSSIPQVTIVRKDYPVPKKLKCSSQY